MSFIATNGIFPELVSPGSEVARMLILKRTVVLSNSNTKEITLLELRKQMLAHIECFKALTLKLFSSAVYVNRAVH